MDYDKMIESFHGIACVLSLKKSGEEKGNEISVVAANQKYLASVRKENEPFIPNRPYTDYVAYDPNFEAMVVDCVSGKKISHLYVNAGLYNAWLDIYMLPLEGDANGCGYCLFTYEMNMETDSGKMLAISEKTAYMVLKTCLKFRENYGFIDTMDSIVRDIRTQCESDGCAIILTDQEKEKIDIIFFDHANSDAFAPIDEDVFFKPEFYKIVQGWSDIMAGSNCIIITTEEEMKEIEKKDVNWYNSLVFSKVNNLVLYPLRVGENLYGYIFATNFNADQTPFIREVMELNSFILSAEVENFRMRQKLEMLSTTDMLTGVSNRNAMNKRVKELELDPSLAEEGIGVIFVDLNGLKVTNDTLGHNEGDRMLKNVSAKLRSVYSDKEIYRAGGDEFLIIITDMDRATFDKHFEKLQSMSQIPGEPTFALGAHYEDTEKDIKAIMHIADQNMYKNKADYYKANPHLNRRAR